jgi:hypothetical protein
LILVIGLSLADGALRLFISTTFTPDTALGLFFAAVVLFGAADTLTTSTAASSPTGHLRLEPVFDFSGSFSIENIPFLKALLPVLEIPLEIPDSACKLNMPSLVAILESKSPNKAYTTLNYRP